MCWRYGEGTRLRDMARKSGHIVVHSLKISGARAGLQDGNFTAVDW